ncbi:MAG TPA: M48 family metallopeptidase [Paludibacteraceae bacterium]|jgi:predicted Zn-dependent protease|nr:M48 family metallopeptidase [Paludibacteraceae bacterium]OPZ02163.1 MAG: TPR repeat-containing protein YfgC precursor [Bacteroidetes bacterium ADurb.BinA395]MBP8966037.1 M48 family metallopeptidase [Paludibacteraceae bacterium]HON02968.1 M48 family metallopeptidase [Paludibacteraceae bacterium]HOR39635.1 M48 family metallopeptidase [Paludibacteraceae bacterium]
MRKYIFLSCLTLLLVSCSSVLITGRKQLNFVPEREILSMSSQSYKEFIASAPLSSDKTNTALVKKIGSNIASAVEIYLRNNGLASEIANLSWEFNLVKDTSKNAFCMPGGKVVVFEGILPIAKNEDGLAVVMGHEIAHAIAKHSNERLSQQMLAQFGAELTNILLSNKSEATRIGINTLYGIGVEMGVMLPYSRKQEYEADRLGLIFLAMAGYNPQESVAFWQRMAAASSGSNIEFLSTHPSDQNRIKKLQEFIPEAMKYYNK